MTLDQVIQMADSLKPNAFSAGAKTEWVNECEGMVQTQVMLFAIEEVITYDYASDKDKELLVIAPHSKIYWAYVCAMIDFANGEYDKYANSMQMFNAFFGEYMRWFAKVYRPADTHAGTIEDERFWKGYYLTAYGLAVKHGYKGTESEWVSLVGLHPERKDNPHKVTAGQVGAYTKTETDDKIAEAVTPVERAVAGKLDKVTESVPINRVYGVDMSGEQIMLEAHREFNSPGYIPVYNEDGVIKTGTPKKDTDSVNKKYVDEKGAGKLDKVSSFVRVYPGVYATDDTDGTPHLITATSDLSYIGTSSGYIPLYADGGQLKTATPTSDDSATNKEYVDGKVSGAEVADGNVVWGGKNREDSFGPIDAAMIPTLGANRLAFMPAEAIEVEYSRDGGITWLDYEAADGQKTSCFSGDAVKSSFAIGKSSSSNPTTANDQLRITITQSNSNVYNKFHKFLLYVSTNSSIGCKVTIQGLFGKDLADETAYKTFVDNIPLKSNWGGYTVINNFTPVVFGAGSNHYGKLRFIFTSEGNTTPSTTGLTVQNIYGFGGVGWKTPSNMAKNGHLYKWNADQIAYFPTKVKTSSIPTTDDDLTNKKYVDGKIATLTNKYELIETITLTEATNLIERNSEPDGTAYKFKKLLIYMNAALTDQAGECGVHLWDGTTLAAKNLAFGSKVTTTSSNYMMELSVEDGILHQTTPERADTDYLSMLTKTAAATYFGGVKMMDKISKFTLHQFNSRTFAVGTVIKIYGVRA